MIMHSEIEKTGTQITWAPYISTAPRIDPELKSQWIEALRSGIYEQGQYVLQTMDGKFCCLGVYCDMMKVPSFPSRRMVDVSTAVPAEYEDVIVYGVENGNNSFSVIPREYSIKTEKQDGEFTGHGPVFGVPWYSYDSPEVGILEFVKTKRGELNYVGYNLPMLNDSDLTFDQIADVINFFL